MRQKARHPLGTAMVMAIIISMVMTGMVSALAWVAGEQSQRTRKISQMDQAFYAAEAGIQRVQWYCKAGTLGSQTSPLSGTVNGFSYSVAWTASGSSYNVTSTGTLGAIYYAIRNHDPSQLRPRHRQRYRFR